ncbi:unnamed protein product [Gadus morhua 'NCC']
MGERMGEMMGGRAGSLCLFSESSLLLSQSQPFIRSDAGGPVTPRSFLSQRCPALLPGKHPSPDGAATPTSARRLPLRPAISDTRGAAPRAS